MNLNLAILTDGPTQILNRDDPPSQFLRYDMSMAMHTLLVTGSSGLIGSEIVTHFDFLGWNITRSLDGIFEEVAKKWVHRSAS